MSAADLKADGLKAIAPRGGSGRDRSIQEEWREGHGGAGSKAGRCGTQGGRCACGRSIRRGAGACRGCRWSGSCRIRVGWRVLSEVKQMPSSRDTLCHDGESVRST